MDTEDKRASTDEGRIGTREQRSFLAEIARQVDESDIVALAGHSEDQTFGGIPTSILDEKNVERHVGFDPRQTLGWLTARPMCFQLTKAQPTPPARAVDREPWVPGPPSSSSTEPTSRTR